MAEYTKFLVTDGWLACPRSPYPVAVDRCYRCRHFRDQQDTLLGEDVVCCDYIEIAAEREIADPVGALPTD